MSQRRACPEHVEGHVPKSGPVQQILKGMLPPKKADLSRGISNGGSQERACPSSGLVPRIVQGPLPKAGLPQSDFKLQTGLTLSSTRAHIRTYTRTYVAHHFDTPSSASRPSKAQQAAAHRPHASLQALTEALKPLKWVQVWISATIRVATMASLT